MFALAVVVEDMVEVDKMEIVSGNAVEGVEDMVEVEAVVVVEDMGIQLLVVILHHMELEVGEDTILGEQSVLQVMVLLELLMVNGVKVVLK